MTQKRYYVTAKRIALYVFSTITLLTVGAVAYYYATLYTAGAAQEGYLALTGATVLAGEALEPRYNSTVLIQDGVIIQVADDADIDIPTGAVVLDLSGYTLLPGLIDMHVHLGPELEVGQGMGPAQLPGLVLDYMRYLPDNRRTFLQHGVTAVRDVGNEYEWIMELRQMLRNGTLEGPRLFAAGPLFTTSGGHPITTIGVETTSDAVRLPTTPQEALLAVRELAGADDRVDLIKVVQERGSPGRLLEPIVPDVLLAIVAEAHRQGLPVFAHWGTQQDLEEILAAGVDGVEHIDSRDLLDGWPPHLLAALVDGDISITPTLVVSEVSLPPQFMPPLQQRVGEFHAAGGRVLAGSDAGMPGVPFGAGLHLELELLVASGLTPQAALIAATSEAAKALRTDQIGAVEPGRAADLVVVAGDPLREIQAARHIVLVFRDGRLVVDNRDEGQ